MKSGYIKISRFNEGLIVLKPDYYLNKGKKVISDILEKGISNTTLATVSKKLYQGGIFKRVFVEKDDYAYEYLTASDMVKSDPSESSKKISKKYTPWIEEMMLSDKQILMSCAGTVGNTVLVNDCFSKRIGSQEIIRIETDILPYGFLYAYLSSTYANEYIQSMIYGAVVPRISPAELGRLPILLFSTNIQNEIHNLIVESSTLRVDANKLLNDAINLFENEIDSSKTNLGFQFGTINSNSLSTFHKRLDGQYQLLWKSLAKEKKSFIKYEKILNFAKSIFVGGRGKRIYVQNGIPFLSSSDMMLYNPKRNCKKVSKNTPGLQSMLVSKYDILISRSGTVGNTIIVGEDLTNTAISEHALRLVIDKEKINPNYVFCYLKTIQGKRCLEASSFGSVIITLNEDLIGNIELPLLDIKTIKTINEMIDKYISKLDLSTKKENQAIDLIEKEIESWQKS